MAAAAMADNLGVTFLRGPEQLYLSDLLFHLMAIPLSPSFISGHLLWHWRILLPYFSSSLVQGHLRVHQDWQECPSSLEVPSRVPDLRIYRFAKIDLRGLLIVFFYFPQPRFYPCIRIPVLFPPFRV